MLEVKNLSKRYGEKQALHSVSFSIQGREAVGFLGINGAGKTTTMNILTGYISASDGDVVIDGIDVLTDPLKAKTRIGYLPEQPPVYGDMRVDEYLNFIYQLKKVKNPAGPGGISTGHHGAGGDHRRGQADDPQPLQRI